MNDDKAFNHLMTHIAAAEGIIKAELCKYAEDNLTETKDKIALVAVVSVGMASAAIHAAAVSTAQRGNRAMGEMLIGLVKEVILPELKLLTEALQKAGGRA